MRNNIKHNVIHSCVALFSFVFLSIQTSALIETPKLCYYGFADGNSFQDMELLNDNGMLGFEFLYTYHIDCENDYTDPQCYTWDDLMYGVNPRYDTLRFVLRDDMNQTEAQKEAEQIVQKHFQNEKVFHHTIGGKIAYDIRTSNENERTADASENLMCELSAAGLISEFYTWGQTAKYIQINHGYLTAYRETDTDWYNHTNERVQFDWEAIESWLKEHHPECQFACIQDTDTTSDMAQMIRSAFFEGIPGEKIYAIIPPKDTSFTEHFALAAELWKVFHIHVNAYPTTLEENTPPLIGQNALSVAGDINIDCSIDVADAVLLARFCVEDAAANITQTGLGNADYDGDGMTTILDVTAILRKIAKLD